MGEQLRTALRFAFKGLEVGGNYVLRLAVVVIFMRFEGAKRWG